MSGDVTRGLNADGGPQLQDALYDEVRRIAQRELRRMGPERTLSPTALVNEAWLKVAHAHSQWDSRQHFLASMARVMRNVLIDYARERGAQRRGGDALHVTLDGLEVDDGAGGEAVELLAIDRALTQLAELDPRLEQVVELRFFAGMTVPEIASTLGFSEPTIKRDLRSARAFIAAELGGAP